MKLKITFILTLFIQFCFAQIGANQLYQKSTGAHDSNSFMNNASASSNISNPKASVVGNQMIFKTSVLINVLPDNYIITLGLNQEAKDVKTCNQKINDRIQNFLKSIKKIGVTERDTYVDFITQNKVYNYDTSEENYNIHVNQVESGYEIKKNIIISVKDISIFDQLVEIASYYEIHNIIDVDYQFSNQTEIYNQLFVEVNKIIESRKKWLNYNTYVWEDTPDIQVDFRAIQPGNSYKNFEAYESESITYANQHYKNQKLILQKEMRKSKTFYYDRLDSAQIDKIINPNLPEVALQFIMHVSTIYSKKG